MSRIQENDPNRLLFFQRIFVDRIQSIEHECIVIGHQHALARNSAVGELLCIASGLTSLGVLNAQTHVTTTGARIQRFKSSGGNVAAHVMPANVKFGATEHAWELVAQDGPDEQQGLQHLPRGIQRRLRDLFANTTDMWQQFNYADSCAERVPGNPDVGLVHAVRDSVKHVLAAPHKPPRQLAAGFQRYDREERNHEVDIREALVRDAFQDIYLPKARQALMQAERYIDSLVDHPRNDTVKADWEHDERKHWAMLLNRYLRACLKETPTNHEPSCFAANQVQLIRNDFRII